jgi:hypothetical protein
MQTDDVVRGAHTIDIQRRSTSVDSFPIRNSTYASAGEQTRNTVPYAIAS